MKMRLIWTFLAFTGTSAVKMHATSCENQSLWDMEGVSHVAAAAFEQQLISLNVQKALSNARSELDLEAQDHLKLTAHGLNKILLQASSIRPTLSGAFGSAKAQFA